MAEIVADRVCETSTTTGSGSYTLAGAVTGFRAFSAVCANGDTVRCFVESVDVNAVPNGDWEIGTYTWGTGGTLARTSVEASSNAGAAVNWAAGTRRIGLTFTASKLVMPSYVGCRAYNDGTQSIPNNVSTAITFAQEEWDTTAIHSTSSNTSQFVVPAGYAGKWRATWHVGYPTNATGSRISFIRKNGNPAANSAVIGSGSQQPGSSVSNWDVHGTATVDLIVGDYIELLVFQNSGGALAVGSTLAVDQGRVNSFELQFLGA